MRIFFADHDFWRSHFKSVRRVAGRHTYDANRHMDVRAFQGLILSGHLRGYSNKGTKIPIEF